MNMIANLFTNAAVLMAGILVLIKLFVPDEARFRIDIRVLVGVIVGFLYLACVGVVTILGMVIV